MTRRENWYFRGWECRTCIGKNGRAGKELVYIGEYYTFRLEQQALTRLKTVYGGITAALLVCYVLSSLELPAGSRTLWGGACILTIIPLMYLTMGMVNLFRTPLEMTYRDVHASWNRIHYAAMFSTILLGIAAIGEAIYIVKLETAPAADLRWLVGQVVCLSCSAAILWLSLRFPPKMKTPELR